MTKIKQGEKVKIVKEMQTKNYKLQTLLKCAKLPKSTFHNQQKNIDKVAERNEFLVEVIRTASLENKGRFGVIRICHYLKNDGLNVNHKRVQRLMKLMNLKGKYPKKKYNSYRGEENRAIPNLINRNFIAEAPLEKITTDVTQFDLGFCKCYLAQTLDMFNNEILSWDLSLSPNMEQQIHMLNDLQKHIQNYKNATGYCPKKTIFHSDQGWQYQHETYKKFLRENGIVQSMSRKGNCYDNSIMESFFGRMKNEMFYGCEKDFKTFGEFKAAVSEYMDEYNNKRIQKKTGWLPPTKFREQCMTKKNF